MGPLRPAEFSWPTTARVTVPRARTTNPFMGASLEIVARATGAACSSNGTVCSGPPGVKQRMTDSGRGPLGKPMAVSEREKRSGSPPFLARVLDALRELYGKPIPPTLTDPFELILYENVAYLADDARREEAFGMLRERVGLSPEKILQAPRATLLEVARRGIVPAQTVEKLQAIAS